METQRPRTSTRSRKTRETDVELQVKLDGSGEHEVSTGLPFFDHMLSQISKHSLIDLRINAKGDLDVDAHHLVEDVGLTLGAALHEALGDMKGVERFSSVSIPMDETLVDIALDISGRPYLYYGVELAESSPLGSPGFEPQLAEEFFRALVITGNLTVHVSLVRGRNTHHILEGVFKGFGRALRAAKEVSGTAIPSTKGVI